MALQTRLLVLVLLVGAPMSIGCSGNNASPTQVGGAPAGGAGAGGGTLASTVATTGAAGQPATGGTTAPVNPPPGGASGGSIGSGGVDVTGGTNAPGGSTVQGGSENSGTTSVGGIPVAGGIAGAGGTTRSGGAGAGGRGPDGGLGGAGGDGGAAGGIAGAAGGRGGASARGGSSPSGGARGSVDGGTASGGTGPIPDAAPVDPSKKITIWMVGDSTMQNCAGTGQCGWAAEFQQYCGPNATVSNQARGGRSIQTWIWGDPNVSKTATDANGECQVLDKTTYSDNWTTMLDPTKGMQPGDWVYIAFGINDAGGACNRHVGTALFQSDLTYLATTIRSKGANPIFGTSTSGQSCSGATNVANRAFGPETKATGAADNVPVVDLTTLSVALYNSLKLCPGGSATFWFDGTHFKTDGATQVAGVVAKAIKDQGIGLAAYLK